ncbi:copper chaperone CopZ [bacterium BMS3Abin03]|nr:copper chaperone CopZ [bacterium BMS3Abin03]
MARREFRIEGMSCHHCVMSVEKELRKIGVDSFKVTIGSAKINYNEKKISTSNLENAIKKAGYQVVN